jgi:hypothetical protein
LFTLEELEVMFGLGGPLSTDRPELFMQSEPNLKAVIFFHSSSWMIILMNGWLKLLTFIDSSKMKSLSQPKEGQILLARGKISYRTYAIQSHSPPKYNFRCHTADCGLLLVRPRK